MTNWRSGDIMGAIAWHLHAYGRAVRAWNALHAYHETIPDLDQETRRYTENVLSDRIGDAWLSLRDLRRRAERMGLDEHGVPID